MTSLTRVIYTILQSESNSGIVLCGNSGYGHWSGSQPLLFIRVGTRAGAARLIFAFSHEKKAKEKFEGGMEEELTIDISRHPSNKKKC